jgi:hypothetical protein
LHSSSVFGEPVTFPAGVDREDVTARVAALIVNVEPVDRAWRGAVGVKARRSGVRPVQDFGRALPQRAG